MYDGIFQFVKNTLQENGGEDCPRHYTFRKRSEHIRRVFNWAKRLLAAADAEVDRKLVLTAALLHDVGHGGPDELHAQRGAEISRAYLINNGFAQEFVDQVVYLVANHSFKNQFLFRKDTPCELIILMEADLLDETGALSLVWDCLAEGKEKGRSFEKALARMHTYSARILESNPMQTPAARRIWREKQALVRGFLEHLAFDLAVGESSAFQNRG